MKKYTQEEFDNIPVVDGCKQCPSGDYSEIKRFGKCCSFGECCRFGEQCSFGDECKCEFGGFYHVISCGGFGSEYRTTYFFGLTDGKICVRCGCFHGTIEEWAEKVKKTHGDSLLAKAYLGLVEPVETMMQFVREERNPNERMD